MIIEDGRDGKVCIVNTEPRLYMVSMVDDPTKPSRRVMTLDALVKDPSVIMTNVPPKSEWPS